MAKDKSVPLGIGLLGGNAKLWQQHYDGLEFRGEIKRASYPSNSSRFYGEIPLGARSLNNLK